MKKTVILSICLLLIMGFAAFAQDDIEDAVAAGTDHCGKYIAMKDKLGLSDGQTAKLKEIRTNLGQKISALVKERNELRKEIRNLVKAEDPDLGAIEAKVKELEKVNTQILMARLSAAKDAGKVLTKEQKEKLKKVRAERKERIKEHRKMMKRGM